MGIIRWNPYRDVFSIQDEINKLFEDTFKERKTSDFWTPNIDILETKEEYKIKMDIPGVFKEDVNISVTGNDLIIKGERKEEKFENETNCYRKEIPYGIFMRQIVLPENVSEENIKALYKDGVLEVRIPKADKAKSKQITIE